MLSKLYPEATPTALDLMARLLAFNPAKRISVADALGHPYLARYRQVSLLLALETHLELPFYFHVASAEVFLQAQELLILRAPPTTASRRCVR